MLLLLLEELEEDDERDELPVLLDDDRDEDRDELLSEELLALHCDIALCVFNRILVICRWVSFAPPNSWSDLNALDLGNFLQCPTALPKREP